MNTIHIDGNLTADPKVNNINNGKTVLNFSIANNKSIKKGDTWEQIASFFEVEYWPTSPQYWIQLLTKGVHIAFEGELKQDRWDDAEGKPHSRIKILLHGFPLIIAKAEKKQEQQPSRPEPQPEQEEDIPF